jgi:formimidoylglutamate deiminase
VRIVNATPLAKYRPGFQTGEMERYFLPRALLPDGWARDVLLTVADGTVTALHSGAAAGNAVRLSGVALPGMPNLHSHAFQRGMAGLAQRGGDFWSWREVMYRFQAALAPDDIEAIAAIAYMEMLEAGFTAVAEFHYVHHAPDGTAYANPAELSARIAAAAETSGIGLTMLPVFYAHGSFNAMPPTPGQRRFVNDIDSYARLLDGTARAIAALPDAQLGIAPHSLRAATIPELGQLVQLAAGRVLHIHIAEQTLEVDDCLAATGQRPVEHLLANIAVDHRWCLVHATHMTVAETTALAATGAVAGLCPITEADLGDGVFPAIAWREASGRFGIGTDSNTAISATQELRLLEYSQRLQHRTRNLLAPSGISSGRYLWDQAVGGGTQALNRPVGAIAPGRRADFVVIDPAHPALLGRDEDTLLDAVTFAAATPCITDVVAGGRHVVRDGRHVARDAILSAYQRTAHRLVDTI